METSARLHLLRQIDLFEGLEPAALEIVAEEATEQRFARDDVPFRQGNEATHAYIVAWGRLRLEQATPEGQTVVLRYMGPGDLLAAVAVLRRIPLPATPIAVEDGMLLAWSAPRLADLMTRFPVLAINVARAVGGRVEELMVRLREVATQRVERRIAATVLRIAARSGQRTDKGVEIPFAMSRQDLAELTATTLHTVSRTLSAWDQQGILASRRSSHLVIIDPHRLVEIAEQA